MWPNFTTHIKLLHVRKKSRNLVLWWAVGRLRVLRNKAVISFSTSALNRRIQEVILPSSVIFFSHQKESKVFKNSDYEKPFLSLLLLPAPGRTVCIHTAGIVNTNSYQRSEVAGTC
jgi:hypothetical protein